VVSQIGFGTSKGTTLEGAGTASMGTYEPDWLVVRRRSRHRQARQSSNVFQGEGMIATAQIQASDSAEPRHIHRWRWDRQHGDQEG